jgi:hypothetical protein
VFLRISIRSGESQDKSKSTKNDISAILKIISMVDILRARFQHLSCIAMISNSIHVIVTSIHGRRMNFSAHVSRNLAAAAAPDLPLLLAVEIGCATVVACSDPKRLIEAVSDDNDEYVVLKALLSGKLKPEAVSEEGQVSARARERGWQGCELDFYIVF